MLDLVKILFKTQNWISLGILVIQNSVLHVSGAACGGGGLAQVLEKLESNV